MRPMCAQDWAPVVIPPGQYHNDEPLTGFQRRDGLGGNPLHPIHWDEHFEAQLAATCTALKERFPGLYIGRHTIRMPCWQGSVAPTIEDYVFVDAPSRLTTTSVTVVLVPADQIHAASIGFHFRGDVLPSLRERMRGRPLRGLAGNLGYYMTPGLIGTKFPWSHSNRYPRFPLPPVPSYIGFHLTKQPDTGQTRGSFQGIYPAAVGIRADGGVNVLARLEIDSYAVSMAGRTFAIEAIDDPDAAQSGIALFTPACRSAEIGAQIAWAEQTGGRSAEWQAYTPMIPLADAADRVHVFVASRGNGDMPHAQVTAVWEGPAPLPSFGGVISFKRSTFESLYSSTARFIDRYLLAPVQIVPFGATPFSDYVRMLGGLVPAVVHGKHLYHTDTVQSVMQRLTEHAGATSPLARTAQESRNFDPYIREPAGLLVQTAHRIGWVLLDGRHELSIGASIVDTAQILYKLQESGVFGEPIETAVFIDGGSAMKVYGIESDSDTVHLDLLNRVAAGSRNGPGIDSDGLNLYTLLTLGR